MDKSGEAKGLYPDLIREIAAKEQWEMQFVSCNWAECLQFLQEGTIDLMTTIAYTPERAKVMDYNSEPVMDIWGQIFIRPKGNINSILDLADKPVAIMKRDINGKNFITTAEKFGVYCEIVEFPSHDAVFKAIQSGEVVAGVAPQHFGMRHVKEYGLVASSIQFSPFSLYFASKKGLLGSNLAKFDHYLSLWKKDKNSFYYNRLSYWLGGKEFEREIIPVWLVATIATISALAALLYVLNLTLNVKVKKRTVELESEIVSRKKTEEELKEARDNLEHRVEERTAELVMINDQLIQEEQKAQNYLDVASVMLVALNIAGEITLLNQKGCEILGITEKEVLARNWFDHFIPEEDRAEMKKVFAQILAGNEMMLALYENVILTDAGDSRIVSFNNSLLHNNSGEVIGILSSGVDVTKQRQDEEEKRSMQAFLYQQEKMASVGQLAAGVAHEINNPMGFITSNLRTMGNYVDRIFDYLSAQSDLLNSSQVENIDLGKLKKKLKIDYISEDIVELLSESLDGANRVKEIVQNLKGFSRIDEEKVKQSDINECIESTIKVAWNELKYKATLSKDYGEIPLVSCNAQQMNQVFINLLVNAAHSIEDNGEIIIKTWQNSTDHINVSISDTGQGISPEKLPRIFEPFYTTKEMGKGTGLGLSISYDIIKKHNGQITVDSVVGKGTTFTITLPIFKDQDCI